MAMGMTVDRLAQRLSAKVHFIEQGREIACAYAGDFLSLVMGRAKPGCAWFTVMNNVNVAAVACLTDCACVVLCEGTEPDPMLLEKCKAHKIPLLSPRHPIYEACVEFYKASRDEGIL